MKRLIMNVFTGQSQISQMLSGKLGAVEEKVRTSALKGHTKEWG
jgi:hypothetical protein